MLIRSKADAIAFLTIPNNLSFEAMEASFAYAEKRFAKKILGETLYARLDAGITAADLTANETLLLTEVYSVVSLMGYANYIALGNAKVTDQGITAVHTPNEKPAFEWQIKTLRKEALEMAYNAIDELLLYLESVKANFSDWTSSAAYTSFNELFIRTAPEFDECWGINGSRLTFLALVPKMRFVEDFYLESLLCATYLTELQTQHIEGSLTTANAKIVRLLKHYIARLTIYNGLASLAVEVSVFGVTKSFASNSINSSKPADVDELGRVTAQAEKEAAMYKAKILAVLYDDIDNYATFKAGDCYVDPTSEDATGKGLKAYNSFLRT